MNIDILLRTPSSTETEDKEQGPKTKERNGQPTKRKGTGKHSAQSFAEERNVLGLRKKRGKIGDPL